MPIINKETVCGMRMDTIITNNSTHTAPIIAAITCPHPVMSQRGRVEVPNVSKATPRLAPEVTPNTSGPANGL